MSDNIIIIQGDCAPEFAKLADVFAASFSADAGQTEIGASVCVYLNGRPVVDLWGGYSDRARSQPWRREFRAVEGLVRRDGAKSVCGKGLGVGQQKVG